MGKMLLIFLVSAGVIFGVIGLNINLSGSSNANNTIMEISKVQAKNNSASGIEFAITRLSLDTNWTGVNNKPLMNGSVTITVQNTTSKYFNGPNANLTKLRLITSIGTYNNYSDTIRSVIGLPKGATLNIPKFLRYSIASDNNVSLGGNINIRDDNNPLWNANVHTNGNFSMNGNNTVKGFMTYVGTASGTGNTLTTTFQPNTNPDNLPSYYKVSAVPVPAFVPNSFVSIATQIYNTSKTFSGNNTLGTKTNPAIIYVNGDLNIGGNFTGYGVFLVQGNVTTNGNISFTAIDPSGNNLGIYANGSVSIQGGTVRAQILSNSNVSIGSNSQVYGGITAKGLISFQGGANFYYRPITNELTKPFWPNDPDAGTAARVWSYYGN